MVTAETFVESGTLKRLLKESLWNYWREVWKAGENKIYMGGISSWRNHVARQEGFRAKTRKQATESRWWNCRRKTCSLLLKKVSQLMWKLSKETSARLGIWISFASQILFARLSKYFSISFLEIVFAPRGLDFFDVDELKSHPKNVRGISQNISLAIEKKEPVMKSRVALYTELWK